MAGAPDRVKCVIDTPCVAASDDFGLVARAGVVTSDGSPEVVRIAHHAPTEYEGTPLRVDRGVVYHLFGDVVAAQPEVVNLEKAVRLAIVADGGGVEFRFDGCDGAKEIGVDTVAAGGIDDGPVNFRPDIAGRGRQGKEKEHEHGQD